MHYLNLPDKIRAALSGHTRVSLSPGPVPAAVLLPLFYRDDAYHLLLTKRTEHLNHHRGEISFPGGVRHPEDPDLLHTALRETWEEVGIAPAEVEVLGSLDDVYSIHNYVVTPFVGIVPDGPLRVNHSEIDRIIRIPVSHLLQPENYRTEDWNLRGRPHPVHFYSFQSDQVWGLTARILKQFLELVFGKADLSTLT